MTIEQDESWEPTMTWTPSQAVIKTQVKPPNDCRCKEPRSILGDDWGQDRERWWGSVWCQACGFQQYSFVTKK